MKTTNVLPKSFSFDIQQFDISVYENVFKDYVKCFSRRLGVLWIGQFGSLNSPGISDIDLMLVCEDKYCRDLSLASEEFVRQSPLHRYLFIHGLLVVPHSGTKYLYYFHTLDKLQTLWGDSAILNEFEQIDEMIHLFREVLWNSSCWAKTLSFCRQDNVSLRSMLIRTKSLVTSAFHTNLLIENGVSVDTATQRVEQERHQILSAEPRAQSELARASFWNAVKTLIKSDWDLNTWMIQKGLSDGSNKREKIWLSSRHLIVFDDSQHFNPEKFHHHTLGTHITQLPFFYYAIGSLVSQPYIRLEPSLSRLWDMQAATNYDNMYLKHATEKWNNAFWENVNDFRMAGLNPPALDVYPFNMHKADPVMLRLLKQALPIKVRQWLRRLSLRSSG